MDKFGQELLQLLKELLVAYRQLQAVASQRQEAMRTFDVERMNALLEQERPLTERLEALEKARRMLVEKIKFFGGRGFEPTTSAIAAKCGEPLKTQLLVTAAGLRDAVESLNRVNRINSKVATTVVQSLARVLKIVTGIAQHAGLYMRNGKKASVSGIHLLEVTA